MVRLSKKLKALWAFFIDEKDGRRHYNDLCRKCTGECMQSYRAELIYCPKNHTKRSK
jgi:hypothetical protein